MRLFLLLWLTLSTTSHAKLLTVEEKLEKVDSHEEAFQALNERVRDPFVLKGPDGYFYMTGTTAGTNWGETVGVRLWRSENLAEWEDLGFVWKLFEDGQDQGSWHFDIPSKFKDSKNPKAIWAPEIHYLKGNWWIPHCLNGGGHGLLKSTSGDPTGPYTALPSISNKGIDSHLFQDNDNTIYYLWQSEMIAEMDSEMVSLAESPLRLKHDGNHRMGYEGILLLKIGDKYLHIASGRYGYEPSDTYDLYYAVSKSLKGPYGKRRMALKNAGHGNLFQDKQGRWWCTAFDHEFVSKHMEKWSLWLVPIEIEESEDDLLIRSKDPRFQPNEVDQQVVSELAHSGPPREWKGKMPWWRPE